MGESSVTIARVIVYKEEHLLEVGELPWKVGTVGWNDLVIIHHEAETFVEAWEWLEQNYVREAP